jgi:hypothetical protein
MNNSEFGFETEAIRTQLDAQYLEHSVPLYLTSSFVFEDAEDMRASFAEEKTETSIAVTTHTNEFVEKYVRWKALRLVLLCFWNGRSIQLWLHYYNQAIISFRQAVFLNPFIVCELFPQVEYRNHLF